MNPFLTSLCRPIFIIVQIDSLKSSFIRVYYIVIDSAPIIISMLTTVFVFAFVGERMFLGTLQGTQNFYNYKESWLNMFILMTTANFPDIMLPAYNRNRIWCFVVLIMQWWNALGTEFIVIEMLSAWNPQFRSIFTLPLPTVLLVSCNSFIC